MVISGSTLPLKEGSGGAPQDSILRLGIILDQDERVEETIIKIKDDTKLRSNG